MKAEFYISSATGGFFISNRYGVGFRMASNSPKIWRTEKTALHWLPIAQKLHPDAIVKRATE
jgi:hypothetical protein